MLSIFSCAYWPSICFWKKCQFRASAHSFKLDCSELIFSILGYMSCLYILDINPLSVISFADIFSLSVGCLILLSQIIDVGIVFNIQKKVLKTGLINFSPGSRKCSFYTSIIVIPTSLSLPFFLVCCYCFISNSLMWALMEGYPKLWRGC